MEQLRFVVIGLGGYGLVHIDAVKWLAQQGLGKLAGVVALEADRKARPELAASLEREEVTLYHTTEEFMQAGRAGADVLTVPIGIHMHVPVSVAAMRAGLHVYCEKPVAATVQEVDRLIAAEQETGRKVVIGFQHITSNAIRQLKTRVCDGRLGPARSAVLVCGWPRSRQYYSRNDWTGKLRIGNEWILDSPANNALAHYLLNLLYLCSSQPGGSASPSSVQAELYRANEIEGPDTVQIKLTTAEGVDAYILLTHANGKEDGPYLQLECANGRAYWQTDNGRAFVRYHDGTTEAFDNQTESKWRYEPFRDLARAIAEGRSPVCTPAVARPQTVVINAMHESCPEIRAIGGEDLIETEDWEMFPPNTKGMFRRIRGLDDLMRVVVGERAFFSELGIPWAKGVGSRPIDTTDYRHFGPA